MLSENDKIHEKYLLPCYFIEVLYRDKMNDYFISAPPNKYALFIKNMRTKGDT
jgi:hypothetical protein